MHNSFFIYLNLELMKKLLTVLLILPTIIIAQNNLASNGLKKLDHSAYNEWKSIKEQKVSTTGLISVYVVSPPKGDGVLYIQNTDTKGILDSAVRGKNPQINYNEKFVVYTKNASYDSLRQLKLDKVKKDKFPKDTLAIYWVDKDSMTLIPNIKSFKLAEKGDFIAYLLNKDTRPDCPQKKCKLFRKKNKCIKTKTTGTTLIVTNPITNQETEIYQVKTYFFNEKGTQLAYTTSQKGEKDSLTLYVLELDQNLNASLPNIKTLRKNQLSIKSITFDKDGSQLAFLVSNDTNKRKTFALEYWTVGLYEAKIMIDSLSTNMPEDWSVSEFKSPYFSRNGENLFFGINKIPEQEAEDTLLPSEKSKVDVWSWTDKKLQPMQLKQKRIEERRSFLSVYNIESGEFQQLATQKMPNVRLYDHNNSTFGLGIDNENYQKEQSWAFPWKSDYYLVNVKNGKSSLIKKEISYGGILSPSGQFFVWYNGEDSTWHSKNIIDNKEYVINSGVIANFASDNNGNPFLAYPEGMVAWTKENGQEKLIVNSEFDVWSLDPSGQSSPKSITAQKGKFDKVKYRLVNLERDSTYLTINNNLIKGVNESKDEFYVKPSQLEKEYFKSNHTYLYLFKAKKSDKIFFRRMNFTDYPELYVSDLDFSTPKRLTTINPQQKDYNWGSVEMVHWTSYKGLELDGLLYKPQDFDPNKKYPMIVYFYEKYTDDIHRYYAPKPTASIVYPTEYVSNGYIVFIPDIEYTAGHPAQSAYDCILSGTDYLTQNYNWIDSTKMGLQGQSWGGYQTAQLVTMTNKYACGMAGAPVSNMFSAYGGIRWASGMSRQFQYERTQSRIGCTIWECPELYIENSPIFGLPNVHTPLLIMHNDGDGAVPWYQGIEMFMGLRRLNQPVWLLNYNGDQHNLMKNANREDLSIRMRQFFDYYLLGRPMPLWMKEGVKAVDKGKNLDLELSE